MKVFLKSVDSFTISKHATLYNIDTLMFLLNVTFQVKKMSSTMVF